jgi:long-subunit acyl-CoA synthetase (AMP-forming)
MRAFFDSLSANLHGSRLALRSATSQLTYAELCERVRAHAKWARCLPDRVGLLFSKSPDQIVCDLSLSFAGKELVPLPDFFSDSQLSHIISAARLSDAVVDSNNLERARRLGVRVHAMSAEASASDTPATDASRIIFTSGTTGTPKGVRLRSPQMLASVGALAEASAATSSDRYLSVLPNALLLEQIAGIYLPLSLGAEICIAGGTGMLPSTLGAALASAVERTKPTATVLVPEFLEAWLGELQATGKRAPQSLRFVAVGGAPISPTLAEAAWEQGLPVYEGYGLSECSSVVALNRPDRRRPGTVGLPLPNIGVTAEHGEIIVTGPTVMDGYLGDTPHQGPWRTGDLGYFDGDGFLVVSGRKDNVIVTAAGRNISPEWVEQVFTANTRIKRCVVVEFEQEIVALIIPRDSTLCGDPPGLSDLVKFAACELPDYAQPQRYLPMSDSEFNNLDLLTANARPRRSVAKRLVHERSSFLVRHQA